MNSNGVLIDEMIHHLRPPLPLVDSDDATQIGKFYHGRSVFITGATGFLGKALVEKLIRSCPGIKTIYLLIREKHGKDINERLKDLISSQFFDRIRELNNGSNKVIEEKLRPIKGDITLAKFGVSADDMQTLSAECSLVFNSAATIRFSEPISVAVRNNIYSVGQLVEFCDQLENLQAIVHLSTAYSNCHKRDTIYEVFYEPPMGGNEIQKTVEQLRLIQEKIHVYPAIDESFEHKNRLDAMSRNDCEQQRFYFDQYDSNDFLPSKESSDVQQRNKSTVQDRPYDLLSAFTQIALRRSNRPNTYTFTKAISESYLLDEVKARKERYLDDKIPVAIVRPSIVGGAWREPLVGFVDNYNGPTGPILSLYTGALQAMPGRGERIADMVPVDMVASMLATVGWFLVERKQEIHSDKQNRIKSDQGAYVFNMVSGYRNPLLWHQVTDKIAEVAYRYPSKYLARLPSSYFIRAGKFYELYDKFNQRLPALVTDWVGKNLLGQQIEGRSSALVSHSRIKQMTDTLTPFTSNQWCLSDSNTLSLFELLSPQDKSVFHFNVKSIDWGTYLRNYIIGSRIYTLKDEPENVLTAMRSLKRMSHAIKPSNLSPDVVDRRELINSCVLAILLFTVFLYAIQHVFRLQSQIDL